jgi:Uma2 family endonuclease
MATETPGKLFSYEDYAALDDGKRYQVLDGELIETSAPSERHQNVALNLAMILKSFVRENKLGKVMIAPFDVVFKAERPATVLQPDVLFVSKERKGIFTGANIHGVPDLVVEVLSPSSARLDVVRKLRIYAIYGVREYWIVPSDFDRVEVLKLDAGGTFAKPQLFEPGETLASALLPGFTLNVADLFEDED